MLVDDGLTDRNSPLRVAVLLLANVARGAWDDIAWCGEKKLNEWVTVERPKWAATIHYNVGFARSDPKCIFLALGYFGLEGLLSLALAEGIRAHGLWAIGRSFAFILALQFLSIAIYSVQVIVTMRAVLKFAGRREAIYKYGPLPSGGYSTKYTWDKRKLNTVRRLGSNFTARIMGEFYGWNATVQDWRRFARENPRYIPMATFVYIILPFVTLFFLFDQLAYGLPLRPLPGEENYLWISGLYLWKGLPLGIFYLIICLPIHGSVIRQKAAWDRRSRRRPGE
ncbi:MAG TPA: hypothetical protein VIL85_25800 [Thermomicrobiales bacterium]